MSVTNPDPNSYLFYVEEHKTAYLTPFLIGAFAECIITGLILDQLGRYCNSAWTTARVLERSIVLFVTAVGLFQTSAAIYHMYLVNVTHFGDWAQVVVIGWPEDMQPVATIAMATPVQLLLIRRATKAWKWSIFGFIPLVLLQMASISTGIAKTVAVFKYNFAAPAPPSDQPFVFPKLPVDPTYVTYLVASALLDVLTTGLLIVFLMQSRSKVVSTYTRNVIRRMTSLVWVTALPPCVCALVTAAIYIAEPTTFWDLITQSLLGKLYVVSLLVTLNGRSDIVMDQTHDEKPTGGSLAVSGTRWRAGGRSELSVTVDIERSVDQDRNHSTRRTVTNDDDAFDDDDSKYKSRSLPGR